MKKIIYKGAVYEEANFNYENPIEGGVGDNYKVPKSQQSELKKGIEVEKEHIGRNTKLSEKEIDAVAADIAKDHLKEFSKLPKGKGYYKSLDKMEKILEKEEK
jgi:hypothetical protein